ncbi:hypothetical protein [Cetobacterium sp.]|uniref:hypothetical protein n=1 Tax=Cetobacterium sp. TaxID=2071632 RepID=UPI003EE5B7E4
MGQIRKETIRAENTEHTITIEVDLEKELARIEFNFSLTKGIAPLFLLPVWAKSKFETTNFSGGTTFIPDVLRNRTVEVEFKGLIRNYYELLFYSSLDNEYTGFLEYSTIPNEEVGIIINGIRINSISIINNTTIPTMLSIARNHQGELISSSTLDSKRKKRFNIQTIPMLETPYMLNDSITVNSIGEFQKAIYGNFVGENIVICIHGVKYKTLLTGEVSERISKVSIDGKIRLGNSYSFTLEEV